MSAASSDIDFVWNARLLGAAAGLKKAPVSAKPGTPVAFAQLVALHGLGAAAGLGDIASPDKSSPQAFFAAVETAWGAENLPWRSKSAPDTEPPRLRHLLTSIDWLLIWIGGACMAVAGTCLMFRFAQVGLFATIVNSAHLGVDEEAVRRLAHIMFASGSVCWLSGWLATCCLNTVKDRQLMRWSELYARAALSQEPSWLEATGNASRLTQLGAEVMDVANAFSVDGVGAIFEIGGMLVAAITIGLLVTPWYFVLLLIAPILVTVFGVIPPLLGRVKRIGTEAYLATAAANASAAEALTAHRTVAAFCLEESRLASFSALFDHAATIARKAAFTLGLLYGAFASPTSLAFVVGYIYAVSFLTAEMERSEFEYPAVAMPGWGPNASRVLCFQDNSPHMEAVWQNATRCEPGTSRVPMTCQLATIVLRSGNGLAAFGAPNETAFQTILKENHSFGPCSPSADALFISIVVVSVGLSSTLSLAGAAGLISKGQTASANVLTAVRRVCSIPSVFDAVGVAPSTVALGELAFVDVHFSYPSRPNAPICQGFHLSVGAGQVAALVGASGSGKSTAVLLLERFYDPSAGLVTLDGADLTTLNVKWLRSQLGLVSQEPVLFQGTVAENIAHGKPGATQAEIEAAALMANAHDFVSQLGGGGYASEVGLGGAKLSGGQKQRVAIARAVIKQPAVLLLDEATSALDNESEKVVQAALDEIMTKQKRTTIVIAHRLSTIRHADKIAVVSGGKVVEEGPHAELLTRTGGQYAKLIEQHEQHAAKDRQTLAATSAPFADSTMPRGETALEQVRLDDGGKASVQDAQADGVPGASSTRTRTRDGDGAGALPTPATVGVATMPKRRTRGSISTILHVWRLIPENHSILGLGALLSGFNGLMLPFFGLILTFLPTTLFSTDAEYMRSQMATWTGILLLWSIASPLGMGAENVFYSRASSRLVQKLVHSVLCTSLRQDMSFFDMPGNAPTDLDAFLRLKVPRVEALTNAALSGILQLLFSVAGGVLLAAALAGWRLFLFFIGLFPLFAIAFRAQGALQSRYEIKPRPAPGERTSAGVMSEAVLTFRTVASLNMQSRSVQLYSKLLRRELRDSCMLNVTYGFFVGLSKATPILAIGSLYLYAIYLVANDLCGDDCLVASLLTINLTICLGQGIAELSGYVATITTGVNAAVAVVDFCDQVPRIDGLSTEGATPDVTRGELAFVDVHFSYPSRPNAPICQGFHLSVGAGQVAALVGASGSGKSTAVLLLERFYDPSAGLVTLDGADLTTLNVKWLRSQLGLVSQEPVLFQGTVAENIAHGKPGATQAEIEAAALMANAHDFVSQLGGGGYASEVGLGGAKLSGGQKQRVAIARAVIKQPAVLLLDEATSALDNESEKVVQAALDEIMTKQKRTTIVIAHRLSTIRHADKIAVVSGGKVVEEGPHAELLTRTGGQYAKLVSLQLSS